MTSASALEFLKHCIAPWKLQSIGRHWSKIHLIGRDTLRVLSLSAIGLLVVGCGGSNTHNSLSQVAISPSAATLTPGQSQQFTVAGSASAETLMWAINGIQGGNASVGTISPDGLYIAPVGSSTPASVTVSATSASTSGVSAQAIVTFSHSSLTLSPSLATVATAATIQFTASSPSQSGGTLVWKVNGAVGGSSALGTISASGLYSAPSCSPSSTPLTVVVTSSNDPLATAQAQLNVISAFALSPAQAAVPIGQTLQFDLTSSGPATPAVQWSVNGTVGGNSQVGFVSANGTFTAPASIPAQPISVTVTDTTQGCSIANATVQIYDPAVNEAHDKWLAGVADAAASYGCTDVSVQQEADESVQSALTRYENTTEQGSCLVLFPISTDTAILRYSLAWGGNASGKDILYISDVGDTRIWNAVATN